MLICDADMQDADMQDADMQDADMQTKKYPTPVIGVGYKYWRRV